jgi:hypothetical protein
MPALERERIAPVMISLNPRLHWHRLDADYVAFHRDSGNTFLANGMAARIFAALIAGPIADDKLARTICPGETPDSAQSPDSAEAVEAAVEAMHVFEASLSFLKGLDAVVTDGGH